MKAGFTAGIVTGLLVGAAATMVMDPVTDKQRRKMKKDTYKVFRTIGGMFDDMVDTCRSW